MKRFKLFALFLCLIFCLSACTQTELPDDPSESLGDSSLPGSDIISQSKTEPEPYKITLNDELMKTNNANRRNGGYIMEEERYIVYRNPVDNGKLYRYEKATGAVKVLYNTTALNGFLHSIQFFDNKIYFVTKAESDESPTLYCTDIEGETLERLIENVGDDYIVTDDMIYYTTARENDGGIFYLYRYDRKRKESALMRPGQCEYLNLVGNELYFVDYTFTGESISSGRGIICKINVITNEIEPIQITDEIGNAIDNCERLFYFNDSLYFDSYIGPFGEGISSLCVYNLDTQKMEVLTDTQKLYSLTQTDDFEIFQFYVLDRSDIYIYLSGIHDYAIIQLKDGEIIVHKEYNINTDHLGYRSHNLYLLNNSPVVYGSTEIIGGEKLMVKAGEI